VCQLKGAEGAGTVQPRMSGAAEAGCSVVGVVGRGVLGEKTAVGEGLLPAQAQSHAAPTGLSRPGPAVMDRFEQESRLPGSFMVMRQV